MLNLYSILIIKKWLKLLKIKCLTEDGYQMLILAAKSSGGKSPWVKALSAPYSSCKESNRTRSGLSSASTWTRKPLIMLRWSSVKSLSPRYCKCLDTLILSGSKTHTRITKSDWTWGSSTSMARVFRSWSRKENLICCHCKRPKCSTS